MLNYYTPFPRYENAIFVGDTATEALAALNIHARGLIGGDIPSMEVLHPAEKMLECTSCALRNRPQILDAAARRMNADYILLEENGLPTLNPAVLKTPLEEEGFAVRVLDVRGDAMTVVERAAALYGEDAIKHAARVRRDYETRLARVDAAPKLPSLPVLVLLGVRHPVEDAVYCFAATRRSDISRDMLERIGCVNVFEAHVTKESVPGMVALDADNLAELLRSADPAVVALCGDAAAAMEYVQSAFRRMRNTSADHSSQRAPVCLPLPWYCRPMGWRLPRMLEIWMRSLRAVI